MADPIDMISLTPRPSSGSVDMSGNQQNESNESSTQRLMKSFHEVLTERINQVDAMHKDAHRKMKQFAAGEIDNVHDVSIAMQKADMAVNLATMFREKILTAFNELQQLQ